MTMVGPIFPLNEENKIKSKLSNKGNALNCFSLSA